MDDRPYGAPKGYEPPRPPRTMSGETLEVSDRRPGGSRFEDLIAAQATASIAPPHSAEHEFWMAATALCLTLTRLAEKYLEDAEQS